MDYSPPSSLEILQTSPTPLKRHIPESQKAPKSYSISELFGPVINGEGLLAGAITHFVRFNGCDFRCDWCDSLDAVLPERIALHREILSTEQIVERLKALPTAGMITLSGGNPAIHNLSLLIFYLHKEGWEVAVETQGSIPQIWFRECDWVTFSPKPPSSKMPFNELPLIRSVENAVGFNPERRHRVCMKVVIFDDADLNFADRINRQFCRQSPHLPFYLQVGTPQTESKPQVPEMLADYKRLCERVMGNPNFSNARILPQIHKLLWGHGRGI